MHTDTVLLERLVHRHHLHRVELDSRQIVLLHVHSDTQRNYINNLTVWF